MPTMLALLRRHQPHLIDSLGGHQRPVCPPIGGCSPISIGSFSGRRRDAPGNPSEKGDLEELVESCLRSASYHSRSAICFSAICRACWVTCWRERSNSRRNASRSGGGGRGGAKLDARASRHLYLRLFVISTA
jgi:hypothetical protein